jgi:hypothetical protein
MNNDDGVLLLAGGETCLERPLLFPRRFSVALASDGADWHSPVFCLRSRKARQRSSRVRVWCGMWRRCKKMNKKFKSIRRGVVRLGNTLSYAANAMRHVVLTMLIENRRGFCHRRRGSTNIRQLSSASLFRPHAAH